MYIKQVIIEGFKSYRDRTVFGPFDTRHNVVVGRNGSGKSNFFSAIQFVLSDEYAYLKSEQKQNLLHEGPGGKLVRASVEIIIDNSDARIPIKHEEISLRRVIGAKSDQFFLNRKGISRKEIMNLLETAGFSKVNPYYIVKQGKVLQLAIAPDAVRLQLLRDVAGTKVFDERKSDFLILFKDSEEKIEKIKESFTAMTEQLSTLEGQKKELKQYQLHDENRRALEYIIQESQLTENKNKLMELERQRNQSGLKQRKLATNLKSTEETITTFTKKIKEINKDLTTLKEERDILNNDQQYLIRKKTKLEFSIKDLSETLQRDNITKEQAENELVKLTQTIKEKEAELEKIKPLYEEIKAREEDCTRELTLKEQKRKELYEKQGRGSHFKSKNDRDRWITNELNSLNEQIKEKKNYTDNLEADLKEDAKKTVELRKKIEEQSEELERQKKYIDDYNKQCEELQKNKENFQATRNELLRKEINIQINISSLKDDLRKTDQKLRSMIGKPIFNGLDSVRTVLDTFIARGGKDAEIVKEYYGPVIENFKCEKSLYLAVEVTAGNRLFYHVVENDQIATTILKEMNRQKLPGEANFMPLNRLNVCEQHYPDDPDAFPMVSKLVYDDKYNKVFKYLFGKTLLCRNLEAATKLARSSHLDCVTLDGDQASSYGSLTGGYFNPSRSRLETHKNRTETILQIQQCENELQSLEAELFQIETNFNAVESDMQKIVTKTSKAKDVYDKVKVELRLIQEQLSSIEKLRAPKERSLSQCKSSLASMQITKDNLEAELHQDLSSSLSVADQQQVDSLNDDIQRLQKQNKEALDMRMKYETEKNKLENLLSNNLIRRRNYLLNNLQEISLESRKRQLQNCKSKLEETNEKIEKLNKELSAIEQKLQDKCQNLTQEQSELDKWNQNKKDCQEKITENSKTLEKYALKQYLLEEKIQESAEKVNKLGPLPRQSLYDHYVKMLPKKLFKELHETYAQLKKLSHVNKKAIDQFNSLSTQIEKLHKELEEVEKGKASITNLINVLEHRKVEAIHTTFRQASKYFTDIYKKLEPKWNAKLVLKTVESDDGRDISPQDTNVDVFTGIGVRISFLKDGEELEMKDVNQLSVGQKSLVALALIFAVQKCDRVPFYLFDEIDCALDKEHRENLANVIHELSSDAQFITTTFRPELLVHAHKCFGVKFRNMVSHFEHVTRDAARNFIVHEPTRT